jgi:aspartate 1-decarboxylase
MLLTMLRCKLHRATVTECDLNYQGSLKIDADLIRAAGLLVNESIDVYNIDNGERFSTYVIEGKPGSGDIGLNGAAARKAALGDRIIICSYAAMTPEEAKAHKPCVVVLGKDNKIERITSTPGSG